MRALRSLTVIPEDLYVERAADRQLEAILANMGRPGYVLVARQMGKTNLLLNAKRKRRNTGEIFTYLDVSNPFPDIRSFFRNVIDLTLESSLNHFAQITAEIQQERQTTSRLPHKEHEWELRRILKSGIQKLIVCLDEIDALTRSDYSDNVFSFIRSVYFSGRTNFDEFNNLTYLLSGVAEPADIIKNKDISPFNIGEKIYLHDFTVTETAGLLDKARIDLGPAVVERVYQWVRGYPRMTWDVCSILEASLEAGKQVDLEAVDGAVRSIYFADVEAPPVDHIKRLAQESSEIRDALIAIHYGRSEGMGELVRTKLYLAGITRMVPVGKAIEFKNRVLEEALNEEFLLSANARVTISKLDAAREKLSKGSFALAIQDIDAIKADLTGSDLHRALISRSHALIELGLHEEAEATLEPLTRDTQTDIAEDAYFLLGTCRMRTESFAHAMEPLNRAANSSRPHRLYAAVAYAQCAMQTYSSQVSRAEEMCLTIISSPSELLNSEPHFRLPGEALAYAYIVTAVLQKRRNDRDRAKRSLVAATDFATLDQNLRINLMQAEMAAADGKLMWLKKGAQFISECADFRRFPDGRANSISAELLGEYLVWAHQAKLEREVRVVLDRAFVANKEGLTVSELVEELADLVLLRQAKALMSSLLERVVHLDERLIAARVKRDAVGLLIRSDPIQALNYWNAYLGMFSMESRPYLSDFAALNNIVLNSPSAVAPQAAQEAMAVLSEDPTDAASMSLTEQASLDLLRGYLSVYTTLGSSASTSDIQAGTQLATTMSTIGSFDLPGFPEDHVRLMQSALSERLRKCGVRMTISGGLKIGRNQLVEVDYNGAQKIGKFKKFETDLQAGKCRLVGKVFR